MSRYLELCVETRILFNRLVALVEANGFKAGIKGIYRYLMVQYFFKILLLCFRVRSTKLVSRKIHGYKMFLNPADTGLSRQLILFGTREELQTTIVKKWLNPGMTIVEIGANLGYYTLMEASLIGESGKIYAIEPIEENLDLLKRSMFANHYENRIELYHLAISDADGIAQIAKTKSSNGCTMFLNDGERSDYARNNLDKRIKEIISVNTMTLDNFLRNKHMPDLIRMDVEGYETKIIKGMVKTLEDSKSGTKIFLEIHSALYKDPISTVSEIFAAFTRYGFKVEYIVAGLGNVFLEFTQENMIERITSDLGPGVFLVKS